MGNACCHDGTAAGSDASQKQQQGQQGQSPGGAAPPVQQATEALAEQQQRQQHTGIIDKGRDGQSSAFQPPVPTGPAQVAAEPREASALSGAVSAEQVQLQEHAKQNPAAVATQQPQAGTVPAPGIPIPPSQPAAGPQAPAVSAADAPGTALPAAERALSTPIAPQPAQTTTPAPEPKSSAAAPALGTTSQHMSRSPSAADVASGASSQAPVAGPASVAASGEPTPFRSAAGHTVTVDTTRRVPHTPVTGVGSGGAASVGQGTTSSASACHPAGSSQQVSATFPPTGGLSGSTVGVGSTAGSSAPTVDTMGTTSTGNRENPTGFMFGAPRMKEHRKDRRKDKPSKAKSHQSESSNQSRGAGEPGDDGTPATGTTASRPGTMTEGSSIGPGGSGLPLGTVEGSSVAIAGAGSSAVAPSGSSSDAPTMSAMMPGGPGSSAGPMASGEPSSTSPMFDRLGSSAVGDASIGNTGGSSGFRSVRRGGAAPGARALGGAATAAATAAASAAAAAAGVPPSAAPVGVQDATRQLEGVAEDEGSDQASDPPSSSEHLSIMSPPEGSDVENVLQLICNIFQLPVALVAAYRSANIFIRSTAMKLTDDEQWRYSLAQWSMGNVTDLKDVLIVPDATLDERYKTHYCVIKEPRVRFFCASPLRSSTGELLGTLCMADFTERVLEPANLLVVNNLQTLVIRQLERDMALAQERIENEAATEKLQQEMMRALDHFEKCIMFIDTSRIGWEVLYTNLAWEHVTGVPRVHVLGRPLQDFFVALGGAQLDWSTTAAELASRAEFTVNRVAVRQKPDKLVSLHLRSADRLASAQGNSELEGLLPVGLPAWVKSRGNDVHNYFVFVEEIVTQLAAAGSKVYEALAKHVEKVPGLELSHVLGKGGFGSVYYGTWNGQPVAVKMIDNRLTKTNTEGVSLEALMGQELSHPNIVKTIKYVMRSALGASSASGSTSRGTAPHGGHMGSSTTNGGPSGSSRMNSRTPVMPVGVNSRGGPVPPGLEQHAGVSGGPGAPGGPNTPGAGALQSYVTSAQPGLSSMTSAQMMAAADLTSASAMQHLTQLVTDGSTPTTAAPSFSPGQPMIYGGSSTANPDGAANLAQFSAAMRAAKAGTTAATAAGGVDESVGARSNRSNRSNAPAGGASTSTASGMTAVGPPSAGGVSTSSTAAGPPSINSANAPGVPANPATSSASSVSRVASITAAHPGGVPAVPSARAPPPRTSLESIIGVAPAVQPSPAVQPPSPPAQTVVPHNRVDPHAAMTSRMSVAFSTFTSNGEVLVPGKESPISSSGMTPQGGQQASATSGEDMGEVWIIMEFCDRGSLQDALDRGVLKLRKPNGELGETHLPMMVSTAFEVASALQYLHNKGIVHGDLTAWNVMLCSAPDPGADRSGRNFVAKVADFGLSRTLDLRSKIKTRTYGTISHMPPECLISGIISKATDVFAFGVLLWQMYTGLRPWAGMNHGQIIYNVGMKNVQLLFPPGTPPAIADLSSSCTRTEPDLRPSFDDIMAKLGGIRASLGL